MDTRKCTKCGREHPADYFPFKDKAAGKRHSRCLDCQRAAIRSHYQANKQKYLDKAQRRNTRIRGEAEDFILSYFSTHPCVDCGEHDILVLEFDHLRDKEMRVSELIRGSYSLDRVKLEIAKCDVVCANCHRRRTARQVGSYRLNMRP